VARGKVIGGSGSVNGQVFLRGVPEDYDDWAAEGNDQWSYVSLLPFFRKLETDLNVRDDFHGTDGPIPVWRLPREEFLPVNEAFHQASVAAGFPEDPDMNNPDSTGTGALPMIRDVAIPAMKKGADEAGRPIPPLIAHVPICVHDNLDEVRAAMREQFGHPGLPYYQNMLIAAGHPEAKEGKWSDAMIEDVAILGDEETATQKIQELLDMGATEILASPIIAGGDRAASLERTTKLLAQAALSAR